MAIDIDVAVGNAGSSSMTIHWSLLVPGVLLLLFPADRLLSSVIELRSFACFQTLENSPRYRPWWWVPALWLDPFRGFSGTFLLKESLAIRLDSWRSMPEDAYALALAILAMGILCQIFTSRGDRGVLLAPMGYVAGVVLALMPWPSALIGLVAATLGLFSFRQFHAFFSFGAIAIGLLGLALSANVVWIAPAMGAFALPIMAGILTRSSLEIPTRNASRPISSPPSSA